jgi:hypothetical protein
MAIRRLTTALVAAAALTVAASARAQEAGPFVSGHGGLSAGDGGAAPAAGFSVGYWTPRRLGFELEVDSVTGLDFGDLLREFNPPNLVLPGLTIPPPTSEATGRTLSFQTNALFALRGSRVRAALIGGGGVASVHREITLHFPAIVLPEPGSPTFGTIGFEMREERTEASTTVLVLNAGMLVEYRPGPRGLGLGADLRYQHFFVSREPIDALRAAGRVTWSF